MKNLVSCVYICRIAGVSPDLSTHWEVSSLECSILVEAAQACDDDDLGTVCLAEGLAKMVLPAQDS